MIGWDEFDITDGDFYISDSDFYSGSEDVNVPGDKQ